MTTKAIFLTFFTYILFIQIFSYLYGKKAKQNEYQVGDRNSNPLLVIIGMIGDTLSGATYLSVPALVLKNDFQYMPMVLGYCVGYFLITFFLIPLYHRNNYVTIYEWINERLGRFAQKIASLLFILGRVLAAGARLGITAKALHLLIFNQYGISLVATVGGLILFISIYTSWSGIKSLIITDAIQAIIMISGVLGGIFLLKNLTHSINTPTILSFTTPESGGTFFIKSFFTGILITLTMTGMDQNIMQKCLTISSTKKLQKHFIILSFLILIVHLIVLIEGSFLKQWMTLNASTTPLDQLLIEVIFKNGSIITQVLFLLGLVAATLNSSDSLITTLSTSIYRDLLGAKKTISIFKIHFFVAFFIFIVCISIQAFAPVSMISFILNMTGWTYGPLFALFFLALLKEKPSKKSIIFSFVFSFSIFIPLSFFIFKMGPEIILYLGGSILFFHFLFKKLNFKIMRT